MTNYLDIYKNYLLENSNYSFSDALVPQLVLREVITTDERALIQSTVYPTDKLLVLFTQIMAAKRLECHHSLIKVLRKFNQTRFADYLFDHINGITSMNCDGDTIEKNNDREKNNGTQNLINLKLSDPANLKSASTSSAVPDSAAKADSLALQLRLPPLPPKPIFKINPITNKRSITNKSTKSSPATIMKTSDFINEKFVAQGGFGRVFEATLQITNRQVAIKKMSATVARGDQWNVEVEILQQTNHPHIVSILGVVDNSVMGEVWIVMELLNVGSLRPYCTGNKREILNINQKLEISTQCWSALEYLHECAKITHKDIKPENILIHQTHDGGFIAKMCDFGLSKVKATLTITEQSSTIGTWTYFPPEYADRTRNPQQADVYSMGATLCELFANVGFWNNLGVFELAEILNTINRQLKAAVSTTNEEKQFSPGAAALDNCRPIRIRDILRLAVCFSRQQRPNPAEILVTFQVALLFSSTLSTEDKFVANANKIFLKLFRSYNLNSILKTTLFIKEVLYELKANLNSLTAQLTGISCLRNLCLSDQLKDVSQVLLGEIVETGLTAMEIHANNTNLQRNVLAILCEKKYHVLWSGVYDLVRGYNVACGFMMQTKDKQLLEHTLGILVNILTLGYITTPEMKEKFGANLEGMRLVVQVIMQEVVAQKERYAQNKADCKNTNDQKNAPQPTNTLKWSLSLLHLLSEPTTSARRCLIEEGGLEAAIEVLNVFSDLAIKEIAINFLINITYFRDLTARFLRTSSLETCQQLLQSSDVNIMYWAAWLLSKICLQCDYKTWSNNVPTRDACLNALEITEYRCNYESLKVFSWLLSKDNTPVVQLFAMWGLNILCSRRGYYINMFNKQVGANSVKSVLESNANTAIKDRSDDVRQLINELGENILNKAMDQRTQPQTQTRYSNYF